MAESRRKVQQNVRQDDRFLCAHCRRNPGQRYAHIVPDSDGGTYELNNLNFLCVTCDNQLEAARAKQPLKQQIINTQKKIKEKPKTDGFFQTDILFTAGDQVVVHIGGGMTFVNHARILECLQFPERPYLKLNVDELGLLVINAFFEDEGGNTYMEIIDNQMSLHTRNAWDIVLERRSIKFIHRGKEIYLKITQLGDGALDITGRLYLNTGLYAISSQSIREERHNITLSNNTKTFRGDALWQGEGLTLSPNILRF